MSKITVQAPAKLNLTFEIQGLLADGYHEVRTLLQAVDLMDELSFELKRGTTNGVAISLFGPAADDFPLDDGNLIAKAARLFFSEMEESISTHLSVTVTKRIPIGAGLAGGSSDAAATLLALNYLHDHPLTTHELMPLARQLGADVPFLLLGGTCLGTGRGDVLQAVESACPLFFLIVKPRALSISTPWIYQQFDQSKSQLPAGVRPDTDAAAKALQLGNLVKAREAFGNVFEPIVCSHFPQLLSLKERLLQLGSFCCHITGSGPTLYALVDDPEMGHHMRRQISDKAGEQELELFVVKSVEHGVQVVVEEATGP